MGRVPDLRTIKTEDFDKKDQPLIDKLAFPINNFMQNVITVLKNGIDYNNLNRQIVTFTVTVTPDGTPTTPVQFQNRLTTKIQGLSVINAINTSPVPRYPAAGILMSFTSNGNLITINNIAGLGIPSGQTNSDSYTFTVEAIGSNIPTT